MGITTLPVMGNQLSPSFCLENKVKGFGVYVKNDLFERKHFEQMGITYWLFTWFIDKVTVITPEGKGKVWGGKPVRYKRDIEPTFGISDTTYTNWLEILRKHGYIETTRTPYGFVIYVNKIKKHFGHRFQERLESKRSQGKLECLPKNLESNKTMQYDNAPKDNISDKSHEYNLDSKKNNRSLIEKKSKETQPPNSGDPPYPKKYSEKVYPNEDYEKILQAYCAVKGVEPKGGEWNLLKREIKQMFVNGRRIEEILYAIKTLASQHKFSWTLKTVRLRMPELLASGGKR